MSRPFSIYLDAVRFAAALVVLLSHWAYERFTGGAHIWIRELNLGSDAVVVFFVLSGLVIAFTAETKDRTAGAYLFNRATRILSVAAPALALTLLLDRIGAGWNPAAYDGWWYAEQPAWRMAWYGLSFSSEWSIPGVRLGSNGPFWSLSYEVAYYLIFAAVVFLSGVRRILALAALAVIIGPKVLLLLPVWLIGLGVWRHVRAEAGPAPRAVPAMIVLPPLIYALCLAAGAPGHLFAATAAASGIDPRLLGGLLGFSDEFVWNTLIGLLFGVHLAGVAVWLRRRAMVARTGGRLGVLVRWLAGASFSIYLVHYPVLQFLDAVVPDATPARGLLLLVAALVACFLFAQAFERPLKAFRSGTKTFARALSSALPPRGAGARQHLFAPAPPCASDRSERT